MYDKEKHQIEKLKKDYEAGMSPEEITAAFENLMSEYESLLSETRFLTNMSDRLQHKLNSAYEKLHQKTERLEEAQKLTIQRNNDLARGKTELEKEVDKRTNELRKSLEEVIATNRELDNFVYRASHDIRGPIARLLGICNIAAKETQEQKTSGYIKMLTAEAERMNRILSDLLEINSLKHSKIDVTASRMVYIINHALTAVSDNSNYSKVKLAIDVPAELRVTTDLQVCHRLFKNLFESALENLDLEYPAPYLELTCVAKGENLLFNLSFSGIPVAEEHRPLIFDLFFRMSNHIDSTGIELYTARLAAKKLNGSVELLESEYGRTVFQTELPQNLAA